MESELETRTSGVLVSLAESPNAGSRTQSAAGADILFEAKKKKKQSTSSLAGQDDGYEVTFTVTIAMAVPTVYEDQDGQTPSPVAEPGTLVNQNDLLQKRTVDSPRAQNYYHLEYYLLPEEDAMKTDVVTYGVACKIFMERHDAKVIKTWQEGDITWFAWAHRFPRTLMVCTSAPFNTDMLMGEEAV
uniref:DUF4550 domain-containing protein n=1 Tax=Biomphalaria glabrata TaxID=6526 RepID=A0A2C9LTV0_BIOGL